MTIYANIKKIIIKQKNQKNLTQVRKQKRKGKDCIFTIDLKLTTTQSATSQDVATT